MPEKIQITVETAPKPFGNFSQAVKVQNTLYVSGQLPIDPATGKPAGGDVEAQAKLVFQNMTNMMEACGAALSHVITTTLYLTDLRDFPTVDKVSKDFFYFNPPARTTVGVSSLPGNCRLCIDAVAQLDLGSESQGPGMI